MPGILPVSGKPAVTTFQVGDTVYIPYSRTSSGPQAAVVSKTESIVLDANEDGTGEETIYYYFVGQPDEFFLVSTEVFVDKTALETYLDNLIDEA